jgi:hypothetical protein
MYIGPGATLFVPLYEDDRSVDGFPNRSALQPTPDKRVELPQFTGPSNSNVGRDDTIRRA